MYVTCNPLLCSLGRPSQHEQRPHILSEGRKGVLLQPGAIVVVRLASGPSIRRVIETKGTRVRLALGRNREARLPTERVLLETGEFADNEDELNSFSAACESAASDLDLSDVWDLCVGEPSSLSLADIADFYWAEPASPPQLAALLLHLERDDPYFEGSADGYSPRTRQDVIDTLSQRRARAEREAAVSALADRLSSGELPAQPSQHERELLDHLKGFVVYGDNYTRAAPARDLIARAAPKSRDQRREAFSLLVGAGVMSQDEPLELSAADIPSEFHQDLILLAEGVDLDAALSDGNRVDLSGVPTFTIDNADTADRDDAFSLERLNGHYRLGIHIADAASLVDSGGELCAEASRRSASLYLPESVIPMLPPRLSEFLGSLEPGSLRPALSVLAEVTEDGDILDWEIVHSIVRSDTALSYDDVDREAGGGPSEWREPVVVLDRTATARERLRAQAGAISFRRPEIDVSVDNSGTIDVRVIDRASMSRRMVSELMVLANCLMAKFCAANGIPAAYRIQTTNKDASLVHDWDQEYDPVREFAAVRHMSAAKLSSDPERHSGLGVPEYIQATAPLRRYPDLVMQRQIGHFIRTGAHLYRADEVLAIASAADVRIRELARIERLRKRYWFLKYLRQNRSGQKGNGDSSNVFQAVVLEHREHGPSTIELLEYPFRTRIQLTDRDSPGDQIQVRLHDVDLWTRSAHFIRER